MKAETHAGTHHAETITRFFFDEIAAGDSATLLEILTPDGADLGSRSRP